MNSARIIQWKEREVAVREIPRAGWSEQKPPRDCEEVPYALGYAGHGRTGSGGSWTVSLAAINCIPIGPAHNSQPSVIATPTTDGMTEDVPRPYILVVRTQGSMVTVWSYHPNGELAENVEFSWHCVVEGELE